MKVFFLSRTYDIKIFSIIINQHKIRVKRFWKPVKTKHMLFAEELNVTETRGIKRMNERIVYWRYQHHKYPHYMCK